MPSLTAAPGRMPADTKLYLYLNPGRLVADAPFTWDTRQFAGWVPHQTIAYLWPSGPWFAAFEALGVPDWIAHRLWLGTILFLGGWHAPLPALAVGDEERARRIEGQTERPATSVRPLLGSRSSASAGREAEDRSVACGDVDATGGVARDALGTLVRTERQ